MSASSAPTKSCASTTAATACAPAASRSRVPPGMKSLPANRGIECLVVPPKGQPLAGTLIAISERGLDPAGNILGFLIGAAGRHVHGQAHDEFDVSDCALTPRGDLLILERRFSWTRGLAHPHPPRAAARASRRARCSTVRS